MISGKVSSEDRLTTCRGCGAALLSSIGCVCGKNEWVLPPKSVGSDLEFLAEYSIRKRVIGFFGLPGKTFELQQDVKEMHRTIWPSAFRLGQFVADEQGRFGGKRCLELGAGLGLVSLVLKELNSGVVSTDSTLEALDETGMEPCYVLNWSNFEEDVSKSEGALEEKFDFIFGADLLFNSKLHLPLAQTIEFFLKRDVGCKCILAYQVRRPFEEDDFLNEILPSLNLQSSSLEHGKSSHEEDGPPFPIEIAHLTERHRKWTRLISISARDPSSKAGPMTCPGIVL